MNVYFARSIRGGHKNNDQAVNDVILTTIKAAGHTPSLELTTRIERQPDTNRYIYLRDVDWIKRSQALIAEVSNPSLGVGYEIAFAHLTLGLPILCVARRDVKVSAMIAGLFNVVDYEDTSVLRNIIAMWLKTVTVEVVK